MKNALLFIFIGINEAFGASAVVNKIYQDRLDASVIVSPYVKAVPGDFFVAKFQGGNVCFLQILKVKDNFALVDLRICSMKDYIRLGQKLGSSETGDKDVDIASIETESFARISEKEDYWLDPPLPAKVVQGTTLFLSYSFADTINFTGTTPNTYTGAKNSIQGQSTANSAIGIGGEYLFSKEWHFGWSFNAALEFPRNFNYVQVNRIGEDFGRTVPSSVLWLGAIALNLNFTFPKTYIPYLGINFSLPIVTGGDLKLSSQIGLQLGLSKLFGDNLIIDVEYRWLNFRGGLQVNDEVIQFTTAEFFGFLFRVKYLFN